MCIVFVYGLDVGREGIGKGGWGWSTLEKGSYRVWFVWSYSFRLDETSLRVSPWKLYSKLTRQETANWCQPLSPCKHWNSVRIFNLAISGVLWRNVPLPLPCTLSTLTLRGPRRRCRALPAPPWAPYWISPPRPSPGCCRGRWAPPARAAPQHENDGGG